MSSLTEPPEAVCLCYSNFGRVENVLIGYGVWSICSCFIFCVSPSLRRRLHDIPCSITLRVVTLPSSGFDGTAPVTFNVGGMGSSVASSASFDVTFFHCEIGEVWSGTSSSLDSSSDGDPTEACQLCSDVVDGEAKVRGCMAGLPEGLLPSSANMDVSIDGTPAYHHDKYK